MQFCFNRFTYYRAVTENDSPFLCIHFWFIRFRPE